MEDKIMIKHSRGCANPTDNDECSCGVGFKATFKVDMLCGCGWGRLGMPENEVPQHCPLCGFDLWGYADGEWPEPEEDYGY